MASWRLLAMLLLALYLALFPALTALIMARLIDAAPGAGRCSWRRPSGWRPSTCAGTCSAGFPGYRSATAR